MDYFQRRDGALWAEDVPLATVAASHGSPTYVYSRATIARHVAVFKDALGSLDHLLCYAVKANANLALLQVLQGLGCGFDAVSGGELWRVQKAGGRASDTIFSGVGKTDAEIAQALAAGVRYICVESAEEMWAVRDVAQQLGCRAPLAMRVNPDVDAKTHPYISTGLKENKFGVPIALAPELLAAAHASPHLQVVGVSCHIGSQITTLAPFEDAAERVAGLARHLLQAGIPLRHVGMGGGLGIPYDAETPPDPAAYGRALARILAPLGLTVLLEPGRVIVGNAGVLLTRVVRTKQHHARRFAIVDAGMNDLMRPALYGAYHGLEAVEAAVHQRATQAPQDIVGPVCESADTFAKGRLLPHLQAGDLLAIRTAGAYGFAMACNYNGRCRPAEVLVDGATAHLIRDREPVAALWHGERDLHGRPFDASLPTTVR
jgi:diaminopimelate decarboxylase